MHKFIWNLTKIRSDFSKILFCLKTTGQINTLKHHSFCNSSGLHYLRTRI